jgi:hypothetical protein
MAVQPEPIVTTATSPSYVDDGSSLTSASISSSLRSSYSMHSNSLNQTPTQTTHQSFHISVTPYSNRSAKDRLDLFYNQVKGIILTRQHPATGLIPASVAVTSHGDYRDAWVRYILSHFVSCLPYLFLSSM